MGPAVVLVIGIVFAIVGFSAGGLKMPSFFQGPRGDAGKLAGEWTNIEPRTAGITRVQIGGGGVRMWGRCQPTECDWGAPASYDRVDGANGSMVLSWDHKFARRSQDLMLLGDGRLQVVTRTHYVDRSGRPDRDST